MINNIDTSSAMSAENEVPENEVPGTEVPEIDVTGEPAWYRDGNAWVKIFLEPVAPGKFRQFDYIYDVPGENEFPKERWSPKDCQDGFHITRRRDVWFHLPLHGYKSAYIAEVVSMGDELVARAVFNHKVRVVSFGPAVPLADVLGKHPDDFTSERMLTWSVRNNHLDMVKLAASINTDAYAYRWAFELALNKGNDQIAEFLIKECKDDEVRQCMLNESIKYGRTDLVRRMMETTSERVSFFKTACAHGQFEIFQLLRAKYGEPKCSDIIDCAIRGGNVDILKYFKSRGVDMSDFGMFVHACTDYVPSVSTLEYLVSGGADVKHPLIAYIAKRGACVENVREYLLARIDDKSEVPRCEKSDAEIREICNRFLDRIDAGEFDGV
jgi:hypothetical protein